MGSSLPHFSKQVADRLNIELGKAIVGRFSDEEIMIEITENVRGCETYILQSTCAPTQ